MSDRKIYIIKHKTNAEYFKLSFLDSDARYEITLPILPCENAYRGHPDDLVTYTPGVGLTGGVKPGSKSLADWLDRYCFQKYRPYTELWDVPGKIAAEYELTYTILERLRTQKSGKRIELKRKKGGWGGERRGAGKNVPYVPNDEELAYYNDIRRACVKKAASSFSLMPYKTLEMAYEKTYHKKASKRLLKEFSEEVERCQNT